MNRSVSAGMLLVLAGLVVSSALVLNDADAVVTSTWKVNSYEEFDKGDAESALITSVGEVKSGWTLESTTLEFSSAWSAVAGESGTIYVGSDDPGAIYKAKGKKATKLVNIEGALAVVSLAVSGSTLYAGTMPTGEIWSINTDSGKAKKLAKLPDVETVWALAIDSKAGDLYAGTGPNGKLFKVNRKTGAASVAFDSSDKRILSMLATRDGAIWFGTSEKALVFRHEPKTRMTRAMADFAGNEITALAEANGSVIAASNDLKEPTTAGSKTKAAVDAAEKKPKAGESGKSPKAGTVPGADKKTTALVKRKGGRKGKGKLYRIRGDGQLRQLHALTETYFTTLAATNDGRIFAGAGDKGRVYLIDTDESVATAFDVEQRMIAQIVVGAGDRIAFTTADGASLFRVEGKAKKSTYTSKAFDTKAPSRFGKVVWHGNGKLQIQTRTGNTAEPGKGWSRWQTPRARGGAGGTATRAHITSPPGRYIQYRATLSGQSGDILRSTTVYYLPQNKATRIKSITVGSSTSRGKLITLKDGAAKPRSPVVEVKWNVNNDDGDATEYTLAVRREGDATWRTLNTGSKPLTKASYKWNTETFPDGHYRLRVSANDRQANTHARSLQHDKTTALFAVDNQKPSIEGIAVRYPSVTARASDALSAIAEMAYSVDDGPWHVGTVADGLFDDMTEMVGITLPSDMPQGIHTLAIRVADEAGNIGSASVTFRVQ